jgi:hypothetical protein
MSTKEEEFKQRFVAVLQDLQHNGRNDAEAVWLIGSLAATLVDKAQARSWPALKHGLDRNSYDALLRDFQTQGNAFHREGKGKHAYAAQALGVSLIARTQQDTDIQSGNTLLDELIDHAIGIYRRTRGPQSVN